jgi:regulator of sigma E protease
MRKVGRIGAATTDISVSEPIGFGEAVSAGWSGTWRMGGAIVGIVRGLFAGDISVKQLGGPIAITQASVEAGQAGLVRLFELIGFLSINVAILNLLPIPILDGGQVLLNIAESAKGSPFSLRTREYILKVGLAAIGLLFALVMWNDLGTLFRKFFG